MQTGFTIPIVRRYRGAFTCKIDTSQLKKFIQESMLRLELSRFCRPFKHL